MLELVQYVLKMDGEIKQLASTLYQQKSLIVMGRGFNFATCLEGALVSPPPTQSVSPPLLASVCCHRKSRS